MINIQDLKRKLLDQLTESGWRAVLKGFMLSADFDLILHQLVAEVEEQRRFTPTIIEVFEAFRECPYDKLKAVIMGNEPYVEFEWASGIAFDCSKTKKEHQQLRVIFDAIQEQYPEKPYKRNPDLKRWSNQGVLLLNSSLTTQIDKPGKHYAIWKPFIAYLLDYLNIQPPRKIFVFLGNEASHFADLVDEVHFKFILEHPKNAKNHEDGRWKNNDLFIYINSLIDTTKIKW